MDESQKRGTVGEAIFGLVVIFIIVIVILNKFGTNSGTVSNFISPNKQDSNINATSTLLGEFNNPNANSDLYSKYVKQIYDAQNTSGKNADIDSIVSNYQNDLNQSTEIPNPNLNIPDVSASYDAKTYSQNFENLYATLKQNGGTAEGKIIGAQIVNKDTLLALSDFDKENLSRTADAYLEFTKGILALKTPKVYAQKAKDLATCAFNVSYILKQMSKENDQKIYSVWITKYAENMFGIISLGYALQ